MRFDVITLFPAMFAAVTEHGITRRAYEQGLWSLVSWNPREFTTDAHRTVDDRPYGGGPGMVMKVEPLRAAIRESPRRIRHDPDLHLRPVVIQVSQGVEDAFGVMVEVKLPLGVIEGVPELVARGFVSDEGTADVLAEGAVVVADAIAA